eukprot:SAG31_NODE_39536_length_287_cov_1.090426_1_plen_34_part_01
MGKMSLSPKGGLKTSTVELYVKVAPAPTSDVLFY